MTPPIRISAFVTPRSPRKPRSARRSTITTLSRRRKPWRKPSFDDRFSAHCERRIVRPAERHAAGDRLHWFEIGLAGALVVARIDKFYRPFDELHDCHIAGGADLQRAQLGHPVDHL